MYDNKHHKRRAGRLLNTFTINNQTYSIRLTRHAEERLQQRNIDIFQAVGLILSLGEKRITEYSGSNRDIFIQDKHNGFSIVICIEMHTIRLITVIDHIDCYIKEGTIAINI